MPLVQMPDEERQIDDLGKWARRLCGHRPFDTNLEHHEEDRNTNVT